MQERATEREREREREREKERERESVRAEMFGVQSMPSMGSGAEEV